nr:hypothetical protein [Tanacetum cinerariifolium]
MISSLNNHEVDFRISFDESDDEDYTVVFDKNSFSYKIISTNDLKTDLENDNEKVNKPLFPSPEPTRLEMIFGWQVNRVHILDFEGLTPDMRQDLAKRLRMVYTRDDGHEILMSHAWKRLFEIRAPLVHEFLLDFFSTCRIEDKMRLDAAGLHTVEEMAKDGFRAWLGSERVIPNKGDLSDYWVEISSCMDCNTPKLRRSRI